MPIVAVTGQVASRLIGTDAFQEVDTYGMSIPVTKHNFLVRSVAELLEDRAGGIPSRSLGRAGPCLIDMPKDVQQARIDGPRLRGPGVADAALEPDGAVLASMARLIASSERPLLYVRRRVISSERRRKCVRCPRRAGSRRLHAHGAGNHDPGDPCTLGCWACTVAA